jgi:hypothetical protein
MSLLQLPARLAPSAQARRGCSAAIIITSASGLIIGLGAAAN